MTGIILLPHDDKMFLMAVRVWYGFLFGQYTEVCGMTWDEAVRSINRRVREN